MEDELNSTPEDLLTVLASAYKQWTSLHPGQGVFIGPLTADTAILRPFPMAWLYSVDESSPAPPVFGRLSDVFSAGNMPPLSSRALFALAPPPLYTSIPSSLTHPTSVNPPLSNSVQAPNISAGGPYNIIIASINLETDSRSILSNRIHTRPLIISYRNFWNTRAGLLLMTSFPSLTMPLTIQIPLPSASGALIRTLLLPPLTLLPYAVALRTPITLPPMALPLATVTGMQDWHRARAGVLGSPTLLSLSLSPFSSSVL